MQVNPRELYLRGRKPEEIGLGIVTGEPKDLYFPQEIRPGHSRFSDILGSESPMQKLHENSESIL